MEAKFFKPFKILNSISKQTYKFKQLKKLNIYIVLYLSFVMQDPTKKKLIDKNITKMNFDINNNEE